MSKFVKLSLLGITLSFVGIAFGAIAAAGHSHQRSGREREEDGAYSPRDTSHFADGDHHSDFDHEAILGSTKDAEEFDNLPPEEAKKRLRILVEKMDLNNDRQIEKQELKAWIIRSFRMLSQEESGERMKEVDSNTDGKVTWEEYVQETYGVNIKDLNVPTEDLEEQKMLADDKALFAAADKNKDGFLDEKEYLPFSHPEEDPEMLPVILKQTLDDKDLDKDGYINFKEFVGEKAKEKDVNWLEGEKDKFDNDYDKNGDGILDRQEILSWVVPSNEEIAEEEVTHLFASADDDQDNILTFDEIIDHHDIFVGSEATDYGDHLHNMDRFKDEL